jgi:hypothetical protein
MTELLTSKIERCYLTVEKLVLDLDSNWEDELDSLVPRYYGNLDSKIKQEISENDFRQRVLDYSKPKEHPTVLKEIYLEPWLDPVWRNNEALCFNRYKEALFKDKKGSIVSKIDADTYSVLDSCYNPKTSGQWERRGLVYGHVQSGKTANYIGLACKAIDVGYRVVIIMTGMTEDLRRQTQDRVNYGIIGVNEHGEKYGVGESSLPGIDIKPGTQILFDLNTSGIEQLISTLSLDQNIVFVIKKNVSVLKCLIKWLDKKRLAQDINNSKIVDTPFFIIDDEADNASIQSFSKEDYALDQETLEIRSLIERGLRNEDALTDLEKMKLEKAKGRTIKAINRSIRVVLSLIAQKSFVAYTATPYSVISQRSESHETEVDIDGIKYNIDKDSDLFPEHFIIPLDPSNKYMGIEKIFGTAEKIGLPVLDEIPESDVSYFPTKKGEQYVFTEIPESLEDAIAHFLISIYIREHRGQRDHFTMLVHTSYQVDHIDYLAFILDNYLKKFKVTLQIENRLKEKFRYRFATIKNNSKNKIFGEYFDADLKYYTTPSEIDFGRIYEIIDKINLVSYHSRDNQIGLRHHNHKGLYYPDLKNEDAKSMVYIVVGGNRISRGFTLEGLTTSYFARSSGAQDTLYQMGRWFGYRVGYEDLISIFLPADQIKWFKSIVQLEMELREDFRLMREDREMTPSLWEIKIANSAIFDQLNRKLKICDENKLRNTRNRKLSYGGTNKLTKHFSTDREIIQLNCNRTVDFVTKMAAQNNRVINKFLDSDYNLNFKDVDFDQVLSFLGKYTFHEKDDEFATVINYLNESKGHFKGFSIVLKQKKDGDIVSPPWNLKDSKLDLIKKITTVGREMSGGDDGFYFNDNVLDRHNDKIFDLIETPLDKESLDSARVEKQLAGYIHSKRDQSKRPLLIIYLIHDKKTKPSMPGDYNFITSLYLSIPNSGIQVSYRVRRKIV